MDSLIYSLNATMPVFLMIVIGYVLNRAGFFNEGFISAANRFLFTICLPVMIFCDMSRSDIRSDFEGGLVLYCMAITTIAFVLIWIFAKILIKDKSITGAFVQAAYRSSVAVMGFAFMQNIYGNIGLMPMIIIGCVPLYNVYAVIVLTFEGEDSRNNPDKADKIKKAIIGIIKNPIIIGIVTGCLSSLTGLFDHMPIIVVKVLDNLGSIAAPLSLIVIGASFEGAKAFKKIRPTLVCCAVKLILLPAVFITAASALGFRDESLLALTIMLGSPTTPSCYIMAKNMKNDGVLTSSVIASTTLFSSVTLTFCIFLIRSLGLIS